RVVRSRPRLRDQPVVPRIAPVRVVVTGVARPAASSSRSGCPPGGSHCDSTSIVENPGILFGTNECAGSWFAWVMLSMIAVRSIAIRHRAPLIDVRDLLDVEPVVVGTERREDDELRLPLPARGVGWRRSGHVSLGVASLEGGSRRSCRR